MPWRGLMAARSESARSWRARSWRANFWRRGWGDMALALVLFVGAVAYLAALPRNLSQSDEAIHLYEAKRLLGGEVMYRDVFEIITPGWMYLMALLFRVFGTDMATARIGIAVFHAGTMLMIALAARRLGVRRELAWTASVAYLAVCQSAWPIASQHWLSTFLCVLLLLGLVWEEGRSLVAAITAGVVLGLLTGVQQQRGVIMAAGVAAWIVIDDRIERWLGPAQRGPSVWKRLAGLAGGMGLVVAPLLLGLIANAGFQPVWRALVVHPLINYGTTTYCEWGHVNIMTTVQSTFTFPRALKYLPLVFVTLVPRLIIRSWRRDTVAARRLLLLITLCLISMASIAYFPDFIHIAFIAPVFFIAIAESLEWFVGRLPLPRGGQWAGGLVVAAALMTLFGQKLLDNFGRLWRANPITRQTAFGRIELSNPVDADVYDRIEGLLREAPSRDLYCYPIIAHLYLMADAKNPTRYGFFLAGYNSPDQVQEVIDALKAARVPYIVAMPAFTHPGDPIVAYIRQEYEPLGSDPAEALIFRRPLPG